MKDFTPIDIIKIMFTAAVCLCIVISVLGIVFKGNAAPSAEASAVRMGLLDLLKVIVGGVIGGGLVSSVKSKSE